MLNAEKFKKEILDITERDYCFAVSKDRQNIARSCDDIKCEDCIFNEGDDCSCNFPLMKWLLSEYRELIKLSKLEYDILKWIKENTQFEYIVRNEIGHLFASSEKPTKQQYVWTYRERNHELSIFDKLFKFVKCEDAEPTPIKEVLENCEVVNDAEE